MPQLIYLAMAGDDDLMPVAAFTKHADAKGLELAESVEEVYLYDRPAEVRDWHGLIWYLGRPLQTPEETKPGHVPNPYPYSGGPQRHLYDGCPDRVEWSKGMPNAVGFGTVWVWGWDLELVKATGDRLYREDTK